MNTVSARFNLIKYLILLTCALSMHGSEKRTILVFGDSLTAGYGLGKNLSWPSVLEQRIQDEKLPYKVINAGVSGDTSAGGLRRLNWVLRQKIDIFILELGANDGLRGISIDNMKKNLSQIIDRVREKNPQVEIIITGMKMPPNMGEEYATQFEVSFQEVAEEKEALLVPFLLEGVAGHPELNLADGIHPTEEGHKRVADVVWPYLSSVFDKMSKAK